MLVCTQLTIPAPFLYITCVQEAATNAYKMAMAVDLDGERDREIERLRKAEMQRQRDRETQKMIRDQK